MSDALTPHGSPGASTGGHTIVITGNTHRVRMIHGGVTMAGKLLVQQLPLDA